MYVIDAQQMFGLGLNDLHFRSDRTKFEKLKK